MHSGRGGRKAVRDGNSQVTNLASLRFAPAGAVSMAAFMYSANIVLQIYYLTGKMAERLF